MTLQNKEYIKVKLDFKLFFVNSAFLIITSGLDISIFVNLMIGNLYER
jgi:hypothetical protein